MRIGERIRRARAAAGMTQRELATAIGVTHGIVGQWESHRKNPSAGSLRKIAEVTLVSLDALSRDKWAETQGVLVKDERQVLLLRRFVMMSARQQDNLLELLDVAVNLRRGVHEERDSAHARPPTIQNGEVTPG